MEKSPFSLSYEVEEKVVNVFSYLAAGKIKKVEPRILIIE